MTNRRPILLILGLLSAFVFAVARAAPVQPGAGQPRLSASAAAHKSIISSLGFGPDGKSLASAGHDGAVFLWDTAGLKKRHTLPGAIAPVTWSPDGKLLATSAGPGTVAVWDAENAREVGKFTTGQ